MRNLFFYIPFFILLFFFGADVTQSNDNFIADAVENHAADCQINVASSFTTFFVFKSKILLFSENLTLNAFYHRFFIAINKPSAFKHRYPIWIGKRWIFKCLDDWIAYQK